MRPASRCHELEGRFRLIGATADFTKMVPATTIDCLGVEVDLTAKRFRMSPRWVEKLSRDTCPRLGALRSMYERIGTAAVGLLCPAMPLSQTHVRATGNVSIGKPCRTWDIDVELTDDQAKDVDVMQDWVLANGWQRLQQPVTPDECTLDLWCDASDTWIAFVVVDRRNHSVIGANQWCTDPKRHIFVKELDGAVEELKWCNTHRPSERVLCHIDNAATHHCIRKKHSTVLFANQRLLEVSEIPCASLLVRSAEQVADMFTRGVPPALFLGSTDQDLYVSFKLWKKSKKLFYTKLRTQGKRNEEERPTSEPQSHVLFFPLPSMTVHLQSFLLLDEGGQTCSFPKYGKPHTQRDYAFTAEAVLPLFLSLFPPISTVSTWIPADDISLEGGNEVNVCQCRSILGGAPPP